MSFVVLYKLIFMPASIIADKSYQFSIRIVKIHLHLCKTQKSIYGLSRQLLRAGTSIGANVHEAQNAESKIDFIHKFKIAAKEVEETKYWLILCSNSKSYPLCEHLINALHEIDKIITKIISTSKTN